MDWFSCDFFDSFLRLDQLDVPIGSYLADQLLLPMGISAWQSLSGTDVSGSGGGTFRTMPLSQHSLTHIDVLQAFLGVSIEVQADASNGSVAVTVS